LRKRVWEILDVGRPDDKASRAVHLLILSLIALNVVALVLETVRDVHRTAPRLFRAFEVFSVAAFTVEYLLRVWSCTASEQFARPVWGRLRFARTPLAVIDLLAVLPFYLPWLGLDLRFLRSVRFSRFFRVMKIARYSEALRVFGRVFAQKKEQLVAAAFIMFILLLFASSAMYFAESEVQPEQFSSIPAAMWWGITTLTTVGYGDVCPVTPLGKFISAIVAVLGIGTFALPTGILGAGFVEEMQSRRRRPGVCPHCGKELSASESHAPEPKPGPGTET
jgi:voltage-gated potassium channel